MSFLSLMPEWLLVRLSRWNEDDGEPMNDSARELCRRWEALPPPPLADTKEPT